MVRIPASKVSGAWFVDGDDLERAIRDHRERIAERKAATIDYDNRVLRGDLGDWWRSPRRPLRFCILPTGAA
jgi:hypothetical protein